MGRGANVSESASHCRGQTLSQPRSDLQPTHPSLDSSSQTECRCPLEPAGDSGPDSFTTQGSRLGVSGRRQ